MTDPHNQPQDDENSAPPEASSDDAANSQLAEMKDQLLRALADAENTRRRAQKEREDTAKYAVGNFAKEMLGVADNFARALDAIPKDASDPVVKNLVAGIEATERQLRAALERFGIKEMEPLGEPFDPNFHRVMMEIDDPDQPPGTVLQVLQAGYTIHDRLLREALVAVAKGGKTSAKVDTSA
ncbi:MAG: nucleotide exchange factor GrpE [Alphaproteobacteria bacterium]|nr:nucleotide exchange factor GrpE [Alphaproteobacteria bacterium]